MQNEYALAIPYQPRRRRRRSARRRGWPLALAALLAAALLLLSALWRGGPAGRVSGEYAPVEILYQNPELPNGCEVTSLAMVLASAGCPADKLELYRDYLPKADFSYVDAQRYGPSPEKWYVGDAADLSGGWYCFESPVIQAADRWLKAHKSPFRARALTGLSQNELERYAQNRVPLMVWVTLSYAPPQYSESFSWLLEDGTQYRPYRNLHCVVLMGEEGGQYLVADPVKGLTQVDKDTLWDSFSAMGGRAVAVEQ